MLKVFVSISFIFVTSFGWANEIVRADLNRFYGNPTSQNFKALPSWAQNDILTTALRHGPTNLLPEDRSHLKESLKNGTMVQSLATIYQNLSDSEKKIYFTYLYQSHIQGTSQQKNLEGSPYNLEFEGVKVKNGAELHDRLFQLATGNDPARMHKIFCDSFKGTAQIQNGEHLDDSFDYKETSTFRNELRIYKQRMHLISDNCEYKDAQGKQVKFQLSPLISNLETMGEEPPPSNQPQKAKGRLLSNPDSYGVKSYCTETQVRTSVDKALANLYSPKVTNSYGYRFTENGCVLYLDFRKEPVAKKSKQTRWNIYDIYQDMTEQIGDKLNTDTTFDKEDIISAIVKRQSKRPVATKPTSPQSSPQPAPAQRNDSENSGGAIFSPFSKQ